MEFASDLNRAIDRLHIRRRGGFATLPRRFFFDGAVHVSLSDLFFFTCARAIFTSPCIASSRPPIDKRTVSTWCGDVYRSRQRRRTRSPHRRISRWGASENRAAERRGAPPHQQAGPTGKSNAGQTPDGAADAQETCVKAGSSMLPRPVPALLVERPTR